MFKKYLIVFLISMVPLVELRGAILYARLLWTFSAAYRVLKKPEYLRTATMTKDYILEHFVDRERGHGDTGGH